MALGRACQPRRFIPSAIAPLETSTTRLPPACSWATCCAQRAISPASIPAPPAVTSVLPTFTTTVRAAAISVLTEPAPGAVFAVGSSALGMLLPCVRLTLLILLRLLLLLLLRLLLLRSDLPGVPGPRLLLVRLLCLQHADPLQIVRHGEAERPAPRAGGGRNDEVWMFPAQAPHVARRPRLGLLLRQQIGLVEDEPARFAGQGRVVFLQLCGDGPHVRHRIPVRLERGDVDDVEQQTRAG